MLAPSDKQRKWKLAGFDPGRKYVAWAVVVGLPSTGFRLYRHGLIYAPEMGDTWSFGRSLRFWESFFHMFMTRDLRVDAWVVERFKNQAGRAGLGAASEEINLQIPAMSGPAARLVRNTDWKAWFKRYVHPEGAPAYFATPTPHEADAAGLALYLGSVLLPRALQKQVGA